MKSEATRVLIVDDHMMVREGIMSFLEQFEDIRVVGEAENGLEAVALSVSLAPDVVLMDLVMPEMDGIEATRRIKAAAPRTRVLALTSFCTDELVFSALLAGAVGYVLKDSDPSDLVRSVREARRAGRPCIPEPPRGSSRASTSSRIVVPSMRDSPSGSSRCSS